MKAPQVQNVSKDVENDIRLLLKTWDKMTPAYRKFEFIKYAADLRRMGDGWTPGRQLLNVGEIPVKLYHMMAQWFRTEDGRPLYEWRNHPEIMPIFMRQVKAFRVNTSSRPMVNESKIEEDYERNRTD